MLILKRKLETSFVDLFLFCIIIDIVSSLSRSNRDILYTSIKIYSLSNVLINIFMKLENFMSIDGFSDNSSYSYSTRKD